MAIVAPKVHKSLSAAALFALLHKAFSSLGDHRSGTPDISLADALMSAVAMFSLTAPSLLAFDKERAEGNLHPIYGIECVPCDTSMREILDPVEPKALRPVCKQVCRQLQRRNVLQEMAFVQGHYLLALDGTGYFSSKQMHCASCLDTQHRNGTLTYAQHMLGAALIHPDKRAVIPLMPEPIVKQDGTDKNDCERNAAKRFLAKFRHDYPDLKVIVTEDSLSSNAPHIETLPDDDVHDLLGVKEGDHAFLFQQVAQAEQVGRVTYYERDDAKKGVQHRFRFVSDMPLNASNTALRVNFLECWERPKGTTQHFTWVTDLRLNKGTVYRLMQGARARWRIANDTFNTLQNQGYHFEHNFGHGYQHLSVVFALLMMLAFFVDQVQQLCCPLFQAAWAKWGSKRLLWEKMRALFYDYALDSMEHLLQALYYGLKKSAPILDIASS